MDVPTRPDFECAWLAKLSEGVTRIAGAAACKHILDGSEELDDATPSETVVSWTNRALERLRSVAGEDGLREAMLGCACQYPKEGLAEIRQHYAQTGDVDAAHGMLEERFRAFLRDQLGLSESHAAEVLQRGWGVAGVLEGDTIVATKIPKSGNLAAFLDEEDELVRRELYCHCPRVRDALQSGDYLPAGYCYCGGGYYKGIWEEITQKPVEIELLQSVLAGDEVCQFRIRLAGDGGSSGPP